MAQRTVALELDSHEMNFCMKQEVQMKEARACECQNCLARHTAEMCHDSHRKITSYGFLHAQDACDPAQPAPAGRQGVRDPPRLWL